MKPISNTLYASFLFSIGLAKAAAAAVPLVWCDGCNVTQKQNVAIAQYPGAQQGTAYVGDLVTRTLTAYAVSNEIDDRGPRPYRTIKIADEVAAQSPQKDTGEGLIAYYFQTPIGWKKSFTSDLSGRIWSASITAQGISYPNRNINVYDVINPGVQQNNLTDWATGLTGTVTNSIPIGLGKIAETFKIIDLSRAPSIEINIQFDDGSRITLKVDYSTGSPKTTVDDASGRDSHNNNVPSMRNKDAAIGTYSFDGPGNPTDYTNWQKQMHILGFQIGGGAAIGTGWHGRACVKTREGPNAVYTCTYH